MTLIAAKRLQKKMPYKKIYLDTVEDCYRLIDPTNLYHYLDDEGKSHIRNNPKTLIPIHA